MLQANNLLMKRGTLLDEEPRVGRKVFKTIGFPDFASGVFVVFPGYFPATVSDFETVFLCLLRPSANPLSWPVASLPRRALSGVRLPKHLFRFGARTQMKQHKQHEIPGQAQHNDPNDYAVQTWFQA
ncbi:hypothetical protein LRS06_03465 [Hymenobacter sp. J193]|uniref:hypothetical protein n=1 Tax=Hymenobacter sp. J193 TaxID=2898429 RepID=UPI0021508B3A|nr:hypothetical protein [Hymenobacter sp. J193]MCR5886845.1 hypothetical protein [Hymenobacter sp. J193]